MGERLSGDGRPGRRRGQSGAVSSAPDTADAAALETALAAVLRPGDLDPGAEQRALAAFRDARATGAHHARTRRRDDWRPAAERRTRRPLKMTFGAVFASLALGGVAVAAIGSVGPSTHRTDAGSQGGHRSAVAPVRPGGADPSAPPGGSRRSGPSAHAQDIEAHCRAYEQVQGRGRALEARAWQRLLTAAGGEDKVAAYCAEQLKRAGAEPSAPAHKGKSGASTGDAGKGTAGGTGTSGHGASGTGTSGDNSGGTDGSGGKSRPSGGKSGGKH
ncbi:hypothetical protein ACFYZB_24890 [Streptomyces sp. NPDC001852]|uniref:hypothetical protein n=1 Tax=Streptomyces sp. NPDC001852 TaxID=3364619 RepID=UPI0036CCA464